MEIGGIGCRPDLVGWRWERVRAAPFDGVEIEMDEIFVDDEEANAG